MNKQSQTGGDYSTNVQAGGPVTVVQSGLSIDDARELALQLARPELERLSDEAAQTACARAEEMIVERLLPRLAELNPAGVETFGDPDVQFALMAAQRTYARTGDKDVADVLVDILVDRTKETTRNVRQLALNESLEVAAKLTGDQFATLSILWLLKYTRNYSIVSRDSLHEYIDTYLAPHVPLLRTSLATFQHLEYAGCGSIGIGQISIEAIFRKTYGGIISKGFTDEEVKGLFGSEAPAKVRDLFMPCMQDPGRQQINAIDERVLKEHAGALGLSEDETNKTLSLFNSCLMNEEEVAAFLRQTRPSVMGPLLDVWRDSAMKHMTLTTVGIAIAHANCRRITGSSPADLSIWIN